MNFGSIVVAGALFYLYKQVVENAPSVEDIKKAAKKVNNAYQDWAVDSKQSGTIDPDKVKDTKARKDGTRGVGAQEPTLAGALKYYSCNYHVLGRVFGVGCENVVKDKKDKKQ